MRAHAGDAPPLGVVHRKMDASVVVQLDRVSGDDFRRVDLAQGLVRLAFQPEDLFVLEEPLHRERQRNTEQQECHRGDADDRNEDPMFHGRSSR